MYIVFVKSKDIRPFILERSLSKCGDGLCILKVEERFDEADDGNVLKNGFYAEIVTGNETCFFNDDLI